MSSHICPKCGLKSVNKKALYQHTQYQCKYNKDSAQTRKQKRDIEMYCKFIENPIDVHVESYRKLRCPVCEKDGYKNTSVLGQHMIGCYNRMIEVDSGCEEIFHRFVDRINEVSQEKKKFKYFGERLVTATLKKQRPHLSSKIKPEPLCPLQPLDLTVSTNISEDSFNVQIFDKNILRIYYLPYLSSQDDLTYICSYLEQQQAFSDSSILIIKTDIQLKEELTNFQLYQIIDTSSLTILQFNDCEVIVGNKSNNPIVMQDLRNKKRILLYENVGFTMSEFDIVIKKDNQDFDITQIHDTVLIKAPFQGITMIDIHNPQKSNFNNLYKQDLIPIVCINYKPFFPCFSVKQYDQGKKDAICELLENVIQKGRDLMMALNDLQIQYYRPQDVYENIGDNIIIDMWFFEIDEYRNMIRGQILRNKVEGDSDRQKGIYERLNTYVENKEPGLIAKVLDIDREYAMKAKNYQTLQQIMGQGIENGDKYCMLRLLGIEFSDFRNFKGASIFSFERCSDSCVLLRGRNASGKSNFVALVNLMLFGDRSENVEESFCDGLYQFDNINKQSKRMMARLLVQLDQQETSSKFIIEKICRRSKNKLTTERIIWKAIEISNDQVVDKDCIVNMFGIQYVVSKVSLKKISIQDQRYILGLSKEDCDKANFVDVDCNVQKLISDHIEERCGLSQLRKLRQNYLVSIKSEDSYLLSLQNDLKTLGPKNEEQLLDIKQEPRQSTENIMAEICQKELIFQDIKAKMRIENTKLETLQKDQSLIEEDIRLNNPKNIIFNYSLTQLNTIDTEIDQLLLQISESNQKRQEYLKQIQVLENEKRLCEIDIYKTQLAELQIKATNLSQTINPSHIRQQLEALSANKIQIQQKIQFQQKRLKEAGIEYDQSTHKQICELIEKNINEVQAIVFDKEQNLIALQTKYSATQQDPLQQSVDVRLQQFEYLLRSDIRGDALRIHYAQLRQDILLLLKDAGIQNKETQQKVENKLNEWKESVRKDKDRLRLLQQGKDAIQILIELDQQLGQINNENIKDMQTQLKQYEDVVNIIKEVKMKIEGAEFKNHENEPQIMILKQKDEIERMRSEQYNKMLEQLQIYKKISELQTKVNIIESEIKNVETYLADLFQQYTKVQDQLRGLALLNKQLQKEEEILRIEREKEQRRQDIEGQIIVTAQRIKTCGKLLLTLDTFEEEMCSKEIANIEQYINTIGTKHFPDKRIEIVSRDEYGKKIFEVIQRDLQGKAYSLSSMSGAEKAILKIMVLVFLRRQRNGTKLDTIFLDETFVALDSDNIQREGIFNLLKQEFKKIIVISHDNHLKFKCDEIVEIAQTPDFMGSTIIFH